MKRNAVRIVMLGVLVLILPLCYLPGPVLRNADAASASYYTFGVTPQFEQRKLYAIWKPIIDDLEKRTGLTFKLVTTLKIPDFEKEFLKGGFDFAYPNPYYLLKTIGTEGYIPLVSNKKPLRGILVVHKDSPIMNVLQLNGKTIAFPAPNALAASLLMRADLERLHHVTVRPLYVKTHSSVYLHVAKGLTDAGGGVEKTLQEQDQAVRDSLRIIYKTRDMQSHPVVAHPRVPKEVREKVRRAFLAMDRTPEGRELLSKVPVQELISVSLADYEVMLDWGLDSYWDEGWSED